jgi:hypothetical protein
MLAVFPDNMVNERSDCAAIRQLLYFMEAAATQFNAS